MEGQSMGESLPTQDESERALTALRLLKMMDQHGPKVMVYIIAAQLLGAFSWLQAQTTGICS